jgi:hypothetical protein
LGIVFHKRGKFVLDFTQIANIVEHNGSS